MEARIPHTQTINRALDRLSVYPVPATACDFAYEILMLHSDYVPGLHAETVSRLEAERRAGSSVEKSVSQLSAGRGESLLFQVASLLDLDRIKEIHGRLLVTVLAYFDDDLYRLLSANGYLKALEAELREPFAGLLSAEGKKLYNKKSRQQPEHPGYDQVKSQADNELNNMAEDWLNRYEFAGFLVKLLSQVDLMRGSFSMHLYAPWGAGKTSVMNFMRKHMLADRRNWQPVYFNAWQNQTLSPPWWSLMHVIYNTVKAKLGWRYRVGEYFWRFRLTGMNYLVAFLSLVVVMYALFFYRRSAGELETTVKVVTGILAIITLMFTSVKGMFRNTEKAAESYLNSKSDPMKAFKLRFGRLVKQLSAPVAIFIDDLDRCKSAYVVDLLENIQTLFKEANVLFVVAADKKWVHAAYEVEYSSIKNHVGVEGKSIGPLFVEKMFQLSVALPGVAAEIKQQLWDNMLGMKPVPQQPAAGNEDRTDLNIGTVEGREKAIKKANRKSFRKNHTDRLAILFKSADTDALEKTEHFLRKYSAYVDLNPRSMKGLLNNYSVNKASCLLSHIDVDPHQLILWTILCMRWPALAEHMLTCSEDNLYKKDMPPYIANLLQSCDVKALLSGGEKGPLTWDTLAKCRQVFM